MGTRSCVAKPNGEAIEGRYVHWDGYPSGVGVTLVTAKDTAFGGDLAAMHKKLIDDERIGWSVLAGRDLSLPPAWEEVGEKSANPLSYTVRGEKDDDEILIDSVQAAKHSGCAWLYILTEAGVIVISLYHEGRHVVAWGDEAAMEALG